MDRRTYIRRWIDPVLDLYARSINLSKEFSALPWLMVTIDACFSASIVYFPDRLRSIVEKMFLNYLCEYFCTPSKLITRFSKS